MQFLINMFHLLFIIAHLLIYILFNYQYDAFINMVHLYQYKGITGTFINMVHLLIDIMDISI